MPPVDRHEIIIEDEIANAKYNYVIRCKCGWVGRAYTSLEAEQLSELHLRNQGILKATDGIHSGRL